MTAINDIYWLGIDAGGTCCRVRVENSNGEFLGAGVAGTGHPVHGMDVVEKNVLAATRDALQQANLNPLRLNNIVAAGGYAGAHLPRFEEIVARWQSPFAQHYVTTDLHTACYGAFKGQDGGVLILGTGYSAMANVNGKSHFVGGQGFLLGDAASGAWLGLQAVKYALSWHDGMCPNSRVVQLVEDTYQVSSAELANELIFAQPNEFARCAKALFNLADEQDEAAVQIVQQAVTDATAVIHKLIAYGCEKIAVCGSVGRRLRDYMAQDTQSYLVSPAGSAEQGAIWYARQQWHKNNDNRHKRKFNHVS